MLNFGWPEVSRIDLELVMKLAPTRGSKEGHGHSSPKKPVIKQRIHRTRLYEFDGQPPGMTSYDPYVLSLQAYVTRRS